MNGAQDRIAAEAAAWHIAGQGEEMDWDGFMRWLEADPRHRLAYDEVALADATLIEHRAQVATAFAANDDERGSRDERPIRKWLGWGGSAVAASLLAIVAIQQFVGADAETYTTGTQARLIALADGSSVNLAPHSRLALAENGERLALEGGAWFDIRHDPARSLSISAGGVEITDIGTKFDVQSAAGEVRVEVAEGEVRVSSAAMTAPVNLREGRALRFDPGAGTATVASVAAANIGEWQTGRLSFDGAPLALVAADLSRYAGVRVTVADGLANRHFTGTLVIGDGEAALRDLSQLMDLELDRSGDAYRLESRHR